MSSDRERYDDSTKRPDGLSDLIKKGISTGVKSVLLTEEGVRNMITDLMPKEISTTVRTHLDGLKKDLYTTLVNEFSSFLEHVDVAGEMKKLLSGMTVEIKTEITFVEKGQTRARTRTRKK